jgi:hypothetical protein
MAVGTEQSEILQAIVLSIAVEVMELESKCAPTPFGDPAPVAKLRQ